MKRKCYSVSRNAIDENNNSVSKSWIIFLRAIVAKFTSAAEFSAAGYLAITKISHKQLYIFHKNFSIITVHGFLYYLPRPPALPLRKNEKPKMVQLKKTRKPKVKFLYILFKFWEKIDFFREKSQLLPTNFFLSANNSDDLFFSHRLSFSNFYPPFSNFQPKFTTEFLQIRYFQPKNLKFVYFLVKTQEKPKVFQKTLEKTKGLRKNPKNPRFDRKTQDLGRKPKGCQRCRPQTIYQNY